jgi:predicted secreted protein
MTTSRLTRLESILVLLLLAGAWAAHGESSSADEKKGVPVQGVLVTEKDDGVKLRLPPREALSVQLDFNAGTGHRWKLKNKCKELPLEFEFTLRAPKQIPGGPMHALYLFEAEAVGSCKLTFELVGPTGNVAKTVSYAVEVR